MKWIVLISVILFAVACSDKSEDLGFKKVSVGINLSADDTNGGNTKATGYKRGEAPVYIDGVRLTATSRDFSGFNVTEDFYFKSDDPNDGKDIILTGVAIGGNDFMATGLCNASQGNEHFADLTPVSASSMNDYADKYAQVLRGLKPIYAEYKPWGSVYKAISTTGINTVDITLRTRTHRFSVVLENPDESNYSLKWKLKRGGSELFASSADGFVQPGKVEAFVVNDLVATESGNYVFELTYYTKDSHEQILTNWGSPIVLTEYISVQAGNDKTNYYQFKDRALEDGEADLTMTWNAMKENTSGGNLFD